jgi:soluble lytic murein transglycosylase-like protein
MRRCIVSLIAIGITLCAVTPLRTLAAQSVQADNRLAVRAYASFLHRINPQMPGWQSRDLAKHLLINANRWKLDANVLVALVTVESAWRTHAVSNAGALGLGQLMPRTAGSLRVNPHDPYQNLQGAARYLRGLLTRFHNDPRRYALAFAAYNAGPKAVERYGGIPPYAQTQRYVVKVFSAWQRITQSVHIPKARKIAPHPSAVLSRNGSPDVTYWAGTHN